MSFAEPIREAGRACYRALRPLRRTTIIGPWIDARHVRAVLSRIDGDARQVHVLGPDEFAPYLRALTAWSPFRELPRDLTFEAIIVRQDQLNMLAPPLLAALRGAYRCAFANPRYALFLPAARVTAQMPAAAVVAGRLASLVEPVVAPLPRTSTPADCAVLMTTFNRPAALARSLPQVAALGYAVVVVDDGSTGVPAQQNAALCERYRATRVALPENRGLAAALNVGFGYVMADRRVQWISYFQDDVDVSPVALAELRVLEDRQQRPLLTAYDADEHPAEREEDIAGHRLKMKRSSPAVHLHGHVDYWASVLPIPTEYLGAPRRRWEASLEDYWAVNGAPGAMTRRGLLVPCLPNRVRTFLFDAGDSTWSNPNQPDPPLAGG